MYEYYSISYMHEYYSNQYIYIYININIAAPNACMHTASNVCMNILHISI